jgi:hypothetical protein
MQIDERTVKHLQYFRRQGWWTSFQEIALNQDWEQFKTVPFHLTRQWTDLPGLFCFNNSFLAWLGYHSPLAGLAHRLLYLFRKPFYDYAAARTNVEEKCGPASRKP